MSLKQADNTVGHAARLGVQQNALLAVQLADHEKFVPPMRLQAQKACTRDDQGIDGSTIPLQVVELAADGGDYLATEWLLLLGDIEELGTCPATVIAWSVLT